MRKNLHYIIIVGLIALSFTTASMLSNPNAPRGYTGAPTAGGTTGAKNCTSCHGDFAINTGGGNVTATGLPSGTYTAGTVYNFSITITHGTANRTKWGFAIKAVNTVNNNVVGTFSSTNANATVKGSTNTIELSHATAGSAANSKTYTYSNLKWTAPTTPTTNETNIKFYIVGVAGDNSNDETGDYVHSTTISATLSTVPVTISSFKATAADQNTVKVQWNTVQEINTSYFELQKSNDGINWLYAGTVKANGNTANLSSYSYNDNVSANTGAVVYYRLKMVDINGAERFSPVSSVVIRNKNISVLCKTAMPLKSGSQALYEINSDGAKQVNISVIDMSGKIVYKESRRIDQGSNSIKLSAPVARGIYTIKFATNDFEKVMNQIVQ